MKIKRKTGMVIKKNGGETYIFKNGIANVPGMYHKNTHKRFSITLKEFRELSIQINKED